jgi:peptidoglycan/LPS O-acetylase OafA/YrhL
MLVIVPPQVYMERLTQGFSGNYFDFFPKIFEGKPYPEGNISWHHLWFILYLFIYNLIAAPLFVLLIKNKEAWQNRFEFLGKGKWVYLLTLPGMVIYTSLTLQFPQTNDLIHDWSSFPYWFTFVVVGFICIAFQPLADSLERNRRLSLLLAFVTIIGINYLRWNNKEPWDTIENWSSDWRTYAVLALYPATAWFWVLAIIGYGKKYLNRKHRVLSYINEAVYPFYILHQTIIVILAYYVVEVADSILSKYVFILGVTFIVSIFIYHLIIRQNNILRYLFGMAPKKRKVDLLVAQTLASGNLSPITAQTAL